MFKPPLLLLLTGFILFLADAHHHHHHHHHHRDHHHGVPEVWWKNLGSTPMPKYLRARVSRMHHHTIHKFLQYIKDGLSSHSKSLCHAARMVCDPKEVVSTGLFRPAFRIDGSSQLKKSYFQKSEIVVGQEISFQVATNGLPFVPFLPQKLAQKLAISRTDSLHSLLNMLDISSDSHLGQDMKHTVSTCEKGAVGHKCVNSLEEMVHFIAGTLGSNLDSLQPSRYPSDGKQNLTIREIALNSSPKPHKVMICRQSMFPFFVLDCDVAKKSEIIEVMIEREENDMYSAVMHCSERSSTVVNQDLFSPKPEGEETGSCHWMGPDELVFVSRDEEGEEEGEGEEAEKEFCTTDCIC